MLENLGHAPQAMRRRVEEVLDALGIAHLRERAPSSLSGGERQRCAIAGALAAAPAALVLDEPTSQLDPQGADDVLAAIGRLNADLGTTVLLAEHRLERAAPLADRAVIFDAGCDRRRRPGPPVGRARRVRGRAAGHPPRPPARLGAAPATVREPAASRSAAGPPRGPRRVADAAGPPRRRGARASCSSTPPACASSSAAAPVLAGVSVSARRGEVVALLGRNGAGKTTLLRVLGRLLTPRAGTVGGPGTVAYVPQDPNTLLFAPTVRAELGETLRLLGRSDHGEVDHWLDALDLTHLADRHPRSLAGGERQRVAVAAVAVGGADVLLLDEPTRGMDAPSRAGLERALHAHAAAGGAVVLATHDVELAARSASRAVVLGDGDVVARDRRARCWRARCSRPRCSGCSRRSSPSTRSRAPLAGASSPQADGP